MVVTKRVTALVAVCCGLVFAQTPQWRNLYPSYTGLAFGDGKFMAVSSDGLIKTSGDGGASWSQYSAPQTPQGFTSAGFGGGVFVVTREPRWVMYSLDGGNTWKTEIRDNQPCRYLIYGKGRFIGIGTGGNTFKYTYDRESDMGDWLMVTSDLSNSTDLLHAAFGNDIFVAAGDNIVSSGDGNGWTQRQGGLSAPVSLAAYGNDRFVALSSLGGAVYTSENGIDWTPQSSPGLPVGMADIAFGGGKFVAVGSDGAAAVSPDGISWTPSTLNPNDNFKAVKYGEGAGFMALGAGGSVYTSPDGGTWTPKAVGRTMSYNEIVSGGGKYVAVGDSGASVSADGLDWSRAAASEGSFRGLRHVAFGAGKFVVAGDSGALFVSEDGAAWEDASRSNREMMFTGVAFGNEMFVVVGYMGNAACFLTSEDGQNWREGTNTTGWQLIYPISLAYGSGKFWAGAGGGGSAGAGVLRSSEGGVYWTNETLPAGATGYKYVSITSVNNQLIALGATSAGDAFTIITSTNGADWTSIPAPPNMAVRSVTFAKSFYIAAGDSGKIMASPVGQAWSSQTFATNKNLRTVYTADGNTVLAGGADGALLYSNDNPISVRYAQASKGGATRSFSMKLEKMGRMTAVTLSFAPKTTGTIAVYSLTGRLLFRKNVGAGERKVMLSGRAAAVSSGSVIVRYTGDGRTVARRFQVAK